MLEKKYYDGMQIHDVICECLDDYDTILTILEKFASLPSAINADRKTEPTCSKMEQVDKDINVRSKDEQQTCSVNGRPYDCGNCEYHKCTADEPQTERYCTNCKHNGVIEDYECRECNGMDNHEFIEPQTDNGIGCSRCESRYDCYDRDMPHAVRCNNYGKITDGKE